MCVIQDMIVRGFLIVKVDGYRCPEDLITTLLGHIFCSQETIVGR